MNVKDTTAKLAAGLGTKDSKRGTLLTTTDGKSLDILITSVGKGDKLATAVVSKRFPTMRVTDAASLRAAKAVITARAKEVAAAKPVAKKQPAKKTAAAGKKAAAATAEAKKLDKQLKATRKSGVKVTHTTPQPRTEPVPVHAA